ncbi:condensin-2 complex subunit D3 [Narcine bancroftii]|uniref:condensin-2 complex subunit D3 n=1 Tax=Narcine bancroftii TaxID=1343680 RepID=UPI0038321AE3
MERRPTGGAFGPDQGEEAGHGSLSDSRGRRENTRRRGRGSKLEKLERRQAGADPRLSASLEAFGLRRISPVWVDTIWEVDFTETEPLDVCLEEDITENELEAFSQLYNSIIKFTDQPHQATEVGDIWALFVENNLSHRALVAVLSHFIHIVQNKKATIIQRRYALNAAGLYFLLLEIPGSVANRIFHPVLFNKCLDTIKKSWSAAEGGYRKRKKDVQMKCSQGDRKGRKRARPVRQKENEDELEEDDEEDDVYLSTYDLVLIKDDIFFLLKNFLRLLSKFPLKEKLDNAHHCLQLFTELTNFELVPGGIELSDSLNLEGMKSLSELAYYGLKLLCSPIHGDVKEMLLYLFRRLLNIILMVDGEEGTTSVALLGVGQRVVNARDQAIKFVSYLVDEVKETAMPVLRILLQHICTKVPDKAEYRTHGAQALVKLLTKLSSVDCVAFLDWFYKYSRNIKVSYRNFALDVIMALLKLPAREDYHSVTPDLQKYLDNKFWIQVVILGRCSDKAPIIRSRALSCLAQCLDLNVSTALESVQELLLGATKSLHNSLGTPETTEGTENGGSLGTVSACQFGEVLKSIEVTEPEDSTISNVSEIMSLLRVRAGDERTVVRKSAIQVLISILKQNIVLCTQEDLSVLQDRCRDPAPSVRKQALQSITDLLLSQPTNPKVQKAWMNGVITDVIDSENSIQQKALECLNQVIIQQIKNYKDFSREDKHQRLAWDILTLLALEHQELCRYLTKAFFLWSHQDKFTSAFIKDLISHTDTDHAVAAWMLLSKVAESLPKLNYDKIVDSWDDIYRSKTIDNRTIQILSVVGNIALHLSEETRTKLIDEVQNWINAFSSPPEIISQAVETLHKLCQAHCKTTEERQVLLDQVCGKLILVCESYISNIVLTDARAQRVDETMLVRHLFTLGETAQLCPRKVDKKIFLLVQSFLADPPNSSPDADDLPASETLTEFSRSGVSSVVRAHAFFTLGKLCLQHEDLAKKCIAALARELEVCENVAVRNNVIIVICDLCMRYTTMVDRYIPNVAVCLKDNDSFIRKQTLVMLTNLLQEEFIKWKGSLFFRFVSVLVDSDENIRSFAEFCLVHLLLKRNPVMFSQQFIECIFHFNSYEKHEKYNKFSQTERERKLFSLKGNKNKDKRMTIYKFLLQHFTDEQCFSVTNKLAHEILACFVDGMLPLDMEANELLSDTFVVMSCKEIKLSSIRTKAGDEPQLDDEMAMATAVMQAAQKKLISQVQKKNFVENIIPIVSSLKSQLEQKHIPALKDLMHYLREVMQDYRNEVKDLFAADKQLAAELEYDLKKYEEQIGQEEKDKECVPANTTLLTPRVLSHEHVGTKTWSPSMKVAQTTTPQQRTPISKCSIPNPQSGIQHTPKFIKPRSMSLSTVAILNSAKKAAESSQKRSSTKSSNSKNHRLTLKHIDTAVSLQDSEEHATPGVSLSDAAMTERAISTPDRTIDNVTFGMTVSYINTTQTPMAEMDQEQSQEQQQNVLCLVAPDKPVPHPRQWNVESPAAKKVIQLQDRRLSQKKSPLKASN